MKQTICRIFSAAVFGILGGILAGCGGGGGSSMMDMQPPMDEKTTARPLTENEIKVITERVTAKYETLQYRPANTGGFRPDSAGDLLNRVLDDFDLTLSSNPTRNRVDERNVIVLNANVNPGDARVIEVRANTVLINSFTVFVIGQSTLNYLAFLCGSGTDVCPEGDDEHSFKLPSMEYRINGDAVFRFNRGLIENAHAFGNFHINAENKHVEYRWTPYSDLFIDGGFRRFGKADVSYAKLQTDYKNFYFQYTLGNVQSNYYKSGKIDGMAFGWQKNGFAVKTEKPIGNGDKSWLRLFYKTGLK